MAKKKENIKENKGLLNSEKYKITGFRMQAIILTIIGFIFYANSFYNEYALDDGIVIEKNEYVQEGFKGIKKIFKKDAYESFYRQMNAGQQLSGGRYRPLSIATFAIEQQLFGKKNVAAKITDNAKEQYVDLAFLRHFGNVLLYALSVVCLFYFLRFYLLKDNPIAAFATCLLFLIHPIHTEVVANVKSRDEIMSFLFIVLTFTSAFKYRETQKRIQLILGIVFYFLALLSKEYAVTLVVLLPMLFYIGFNDSFIQSIIKSVPYYAATALYMIMRVKAVGLGASAPSPDVLNNPYLFATPVQKLATEIEVLNHYLRLLFFPHPLSSDYSYSTIPYTDFSDMKVWLSIIIHVGMIMLTIVLFFKRHILSFALAFYWMHLAMVSNLVMDIGATMGERLIYHSSFGFALILGWFINKAFEKINEPKKKLNVGIGLGVVVTLLCAFKTIERNAQWKNGTTLFINDALTVPNSAMVNGNVGKAYIDLSEKEENKDNEQIQKEYLNKAIFHLSKSVEVHKRYVNGYLNLAVAYYKIGEIEKAETNWNIARDLYPNNPFLIRSYEALAEAYYNKANKTWKTDSVRAVGYMEKAANYQPQNIAYWYNFGGASFNLGNLEKAKEAWEKTLQLNPNHQQAKMGLAEYWYRTGNALAAGGKIKEAKEAWQKTLQLNPRHPQAPLRLKGN